MFPRLDQRSQADVKELLSPKDRLDYRYFHKRAYFLSVIKSALEQASRKKGDLQGTEVTWDYAAGDRRRPVIAVTAGKGAQTPFFSSDPKADLYRTRPKASTHDSHPCLCPAKYLSSHFTIPNPRSRPT